MTSPVHETVTTRLNPAIDPALHIWGWEITVYLFLGGLVAGLFILSALFELQKAKPSTSSGMRSVPLLALVLLSLGMGTLFLDLEYKAHVYRFYLAFRPSSPMSWGAWILLLVYPVGLLLWLGNLPAALQLPVLARPMAVAQRWRRPLLWLSVAMGVGLGLYTGLLLGTLSARIQWSSTVLGPLFLTSGISTGAALLLLLPLHADERKTLIRWDLVAIATELLLLALLLIGYASGSSAARMAGAVFMGGAWTASFWSLVVVVGLCVPLAMGLLEVRKHLPLIALTPVLVLIGGLSLRAILLASGQETGFRLLP